MKNENLCRLIYLLYIFYYFRFKISLENPYNVKRSDTSENVVCSVV